MTNSPTVAQLDEYYDDLIAEEQYIAETGMTWAEARAENEAEIAAENAWLVYAENAGPTYHEEQELEL